jgi:hypothetical protein
MKPPRRSKAFCLLTTKSPWCRPSIGSSGDGRVAFGGAAGGTSIQVTAEEGADQVALQDKLTAQFAKDASLGEVKFGGAGGPAIGGGSTIDVKLSASSDELLNAGITAVQAAMHRHQGCRRDHQLAGRQAAHPSRHG